MQLLKKIFLLQLLATLLLTQVGYYFFYIIKQYQIKEEIKQQIFAHLPNSSFFVIDENNKNIVWDEAEKECSINGKMYDVVKTKINNGIKTYYCINDVKEEGLLKNYAKQINTQSGNEKHQKTSKLSLKFETIAFEVEHQSSNNFFSKNDMISFLNIEQKATTASISVASPPPKL